MNKRKTILFSVALILPMLIMFQVMDMYSMMWMFLKYLVAEAMLTKEEIVPALKGFGMIAICTLGFAGAVILWDALSKQPKNIN